MTEETEKKLKIAKDEDFIDYPKFKNSISKLIEKYPDGVSDQMIAKTLNITEEEVKNTYKSAIKKLRKSLSK